MPGCSSCARPFIGRLSDRFGRGRPVLLIDAVPAGGGLRGDGLGADAGVAGSGAFDIWDHGSELGRSPIPASLIAFRQSGGGAAFGMLGQRGRCGLLCSARRWAGSRVKLARAALLHSSQRALLALA